MGVDGLMATAFQLEFEIVTDCELPGKAPSDQDGASSQLPLAGFIQEFTCAETKVEVNASADATKRKTRLLPAGRHFGVLIGQTLVFSLPFWNALAAGDRG